MEEELFNVIPYDNDMEFLWDNFVMEKSSNGTFLQTRRFLNYHPSDRFVDASLLIYDKGKLIAVCPACEEYGDGRKVFFSHKGSTFGGLIFNPKYYHAEKVVKIIRTLDMYLRDKGFDKSVLKITPDLFSKCSSSLLQYCLFNQGYQPHMELNTYIDLKKISENVLNNFDRNKKRNIEKCSKYELEFRKLDSDREIADFYRLLEKNLEKYKIKPIHTIDEIREFKNKRLCNETVFYGIFHKNEQIAGGMMFVFEQTNVIHAQNLSADYTFTEYSPITYLYYKIIETAKREGYSKLSWGISTENKGKDLNLTLVRNKESYGSEYSVNYTFWKNVGGGVTHSDLQTGLKNKDNAISYVDLEVA